MIGDPLMSHDPGAKPSHLKRNTIIAFIIGLLIGVLSIIGSCIDSNDDDPAPTTTQVPSDGAQFREWYCTEYTGPDKQGCPDGLP